MKKQQPMTIAATRARIVRLTQMLNLMDQTHSDGLTTRTRASFRRERDRMAAQLHGLVVDEVARGKSEEWGENVMRPFVGADEEAMAEAPPPRDPVHWPAPRYCASPRCTRELPADSTPRRRYCGRYCANTAHRMRHAK